MPVGGVLFGVVAKRLVELRAQLAIAERFDGGGLAAEKSVANSFAKVGIAVFDMRARAATSSASGASGLGCAAQPPRIPSAKTSRESADKSTAPSQSKS